MWRKTPVNYVTNCQLCDDNNVNYVTVNYVTIGNVNYVTRPHVNYVTRPYVNYVTQSVNYVTATGMSTVWQHLSI